MTEKIIWPGNKKFAFSVFDDTDLATVENIRDVYLMLADLGFKTTKSVWPLKGPRKPAIGGSTCEDGQYLDFMLKLKARGFEIGFHNATYHSSTRSETLRALERFRELFGHYPLTMANHADCRESIYWGDYRLTGINKAVYNMLLRNRHKEIFRGAVEGDEHFWGDACKEKVKYVRNFVFLETNTLKACPFMPYHDPLRPYVNYWFASSEGPAVETFNERISERNIDRLEEEGGACIMYTHFGKDFYSGGRINPRFEFLLKRMAKKDVWSVPVGVLLDFLLAANSNHEISGRERAEMERRWLWSKIRIGGSS